MPALRREVILTSYQRQPKCYLVSTPLVDRRRLVFNDDHDKVLVGRSSKSPSKGRVATDDNGLFDCGVISRNHATIYMQSGVVYLQDTESRHGTFVNEVDIRGRSPHQLRTGDKVRFGCPINIGENLYSPIFVCVDIQNEKQEKQMPVTFEVPDASESEEEEEELDEDFTQHEPGHYNEIVDLTSPMGSPRFTDRSPSLRYELIKEVEEADLSSLGITSLTSMGNEDGITSDEDENELLDNTDEINNDEDDILTNEDDIVNDEADAFGHGLAWRTLFNNVNEASDSDEGDSDFVDPDMDEDKFIYDEADSDSDSDLDAAEHAEDDCVLASEALPEAIAQIEPESVVPVEAGHQCVQNQGKRKATELSEVTAQDIEWAAQTPTASVDETLVVNPEVSLVTAPATSCHVEHTMACVLDDGRDGRPSKRLRAFAAGMGYATLGGITAAAVMFGSLAYTAPAF